MKKIKLIAIICFTNVVVAAAQEGWSVGASITPSVYWLYNKDDFSAPRTDVIAQEPKFFNGIQGGVNADYHFSDYAGVKASLLYSTQRQDYSQESTVNDIYFYTQLNYIHLPICFTFNTDPEQGLMLSGELGILPSFLPYYNEFRHFEYKTTGNYQNMNLVNGERKYEEYNASNNTTNYSSYHQDWQYNQWQLGAIGNIGLKYKHEQYSYQLLFGGQYHFTNADNLNATIKDGIYSGNQLWKDRKWKYAGYTPNEPRISSNNISATITLSVSYHFNQ
jgi:hypothetical protein